MSTELINTHEDYLAETAESRPIATSAVESRGNVALFPEADTGNFRQQWHDIQGSFVDEPKDAVQRADELVDSVIKRLADVFAQERKKLEDDWSSGRDVSTEDLRQSLRRYRSFFDRLLSM